MESNFRIFAGIKISNIQRTIEISRSTYDCFFPCVVFSRYQDFET
ncbi:hypothetical protein V6Z12_A07G194300 [Gossypium hirsutum]